MDVNFIMEVKLIGRLKKLKELSRTVAGELLILIDIASTEEDYLKKVYSILVECYASKIDMAATSKFGHHKTTKTWKTIADYWRRGYKSCRLFNFSEKEVEHFIHDIYIY